MKRILISRPMPDSVATAARKFFDVEVRQKQTPMSGAEMRASLALYDAIIPTLGDRYAARTFKDFSNPRCKILANFGVGYNHIDIVAAQAAGICVTNTPGAVTAATADIALMLILMSCRRAGEGERMVRSNRWEGWNPTQMLGQHVTGKTVGIIGMGRIGAAIARRCHFGFEMPVIYFNRSRKTIGMPARQVGSLQELAAHADVVVVAASGGAHSHHLIDAEVFEHMKPTAHLVNISRGDVIDEAALIAALQSRQ
ncbi:MAG: D-glycerate dehydrogenase, partial [Rhodobacteraceae bacterium]|nr:D-glycerate dehydrogenase [Paracoccaceae bacterium]